MYKWNSVSNKPNLCILWFLFLGMFALLMVKIGVYDHQQAPTFTRGDSHSIIISLYLTKKHIYKANAIYVNLPPIVHKVG